jgi:hypothetical protein
MYLLINSCYAHCFFQKQHGVGVQSEALFGRAAWRWSSKRSFVWARSMALEFKTKLCLGAQHGVGVQSEALFGRTAWRGSSKRSFVWARSMALEFKAKLCLAAQSFALNSNVPTMRYFKNNKLHPHF